MNWVITIIKTYFLQHCMQQKIRKSKLGFFYVPYWDNLNCFKRLLHYCALMRTCGLCCHLQSGVNGRCPLTFSLPVLTESLQMFRPTENTRRPLQGSAAGQTLCPLHLRPHLRLWHHVWETKRKNIRQGDIVKQLAHKEAGLPLSILCFIVFSSCNLHHEHHSVETCDWDDKLFYWSHRGSEQQVDSSWPFCSVPVCCVWNTPCWPLDRMQI